MQEIVLSQELSCPVTLRFEIKSVYKGDKYDDTCVSLIYPLTSDCILAQHSRRERKRRMSPAC
ncbi:hypothetical protein [Treponema socranskii]|uniref:hypothetical protein n=1 Tax=Treponema socranskii TaxID=53419 RepID=UPI003F51517F